MTTQASIINKGTFLQLPDVFIETCDLPESAQILFVRLWQNASYKGFFLGSIRKLAKIVRQSKSTVDRMLKVLKDSPLIGIEPAPDDEQDRTVMKITINVGWLWEANLQYLTAKIVPIWDNSNKEKRVKHCPKLGQSVPEKDNLSQNGTLSPKLGRTVPDVSSKVPPYISKTILDQLDISKTVGDVSPVVTDPHTHASLFPDELPPLDTTEPEVPPVSPNGHKPTKPEKPARERKPNKPEKPKTEERSAPPAKVEAPALDEKQQAVFDEWAKMPWFKGVPPRIERAMPAVLTRLAAYNPTSEMMLKVRNWATSKEVDRNGYYKNKGWNIYFLANEIPKWLSMQPSETSPKEIGKMSQEELRDHALSFPPRLDHHTPEYKELQRCLDRLLPDIKKEVVRKRIEAQHKTAAIAS